jgi:8-oxo-dGTP diphosphatase
VPPPPAVAEPRRRLLVAAALIERPGGQILLSRRRPDQSLAGCWEFPGGKIEAGESPEAALAREIEEELGCLVRVEGVFEVVFFGYPTFDLYMLVYRCAILRGTPRALTVAEVAWFDPAQIPELSLPPADYPLAHKLAAAAAAKI